jgi:5-methylcytosine-specific restriction endonuclease McrA
MSFHRPFVRKSSSGTARIVRDSYSNANSKVQWWTIRKEVFTRDGGLCQAIKGGRKCLTKGTDVHHIIPLSRGGTTSKANLMTVCDDCHKDRHSHMG